MSSTMDVKVSHRGQTSLPAELRRRWGLMDGGEVGIIDLGGSALIVPGGITAAKAELYRHFRENYEAGVAAIEDPDLRDQPRSVLDS